MKVEPRPTKRNWVLLSKVCHCTHSCYGQYVCFFVVSRMQSRESLLWQTGPEAFHSWGQAGWIHWSPIGRHKQTMSSKPGIHCECKGKEKKSREVCNYSSRKRGKLICSPLTLSRSFPGPDQRQTCMYLSRHAPLGTDGAYSVWPKITVPLLY